MDGDRRNRPYLLTLAAMEWYMWLRQWLQSDLRISSWAFSEAVDVNCQVALVGLLVVVGLTIRS